MNKTIEQQLTDEWLLTEGNQYIVAGEFRRCLDGTIEFVNEHRQQIPVPVWAIRNMMVAYKNGVLKTGLFPPR